MLTLTLTLYSSGYYYSPIFPYPSPGHRVQIIVSTQVHKKPSLTDMPRNVKERDSSAPPPVFIVRFYSVAESPVIIYHCQWGSEDQASGRPPCIAYGLNH